MQCKETHKCSQNKISWVRVKFSNFPSKVARNCSRARTSRENPVLFIWAFYSSDSMSRFLIWSCKVQCEIDKSPKSPNLANYFEKLIFRKKCQTWTTFPDTESPPKYFIFGGFRKPWLVPKATCLSSPKLSQLRNLGTIGEGHAMSTPARPIKDRPLLNVISCFLKTYVLLFQFISLELLRDAYNIQV